MNEDEYEYPSGDYTVTIVAPDGRTLKFEGYADGPYDALFAAVNRYEMKELEGQ